MFEIGRCFRNEGLSTRHNPEFTMLEFDQGFATYEDLIEEVEELFVYVAETGLHRQGLPNTPGSAGASTRSRWSVRSGASACARRSPSGSALG